MAGLKRTSRRLEIAIDPSSFVQYMASAVEVPIGEEGTWASAIENDVLRAAVNYIEEYCGISVWESEWTLWLDEWPADGVIRLPRPPVVSVESLKYFDSNGVLQTIDLEADTYVSLSSNIPTIQHATNWPTAKVRPNAIECSFAAGFRVDDESPAAAPDLDDSVALAVLQLYAHYLVNRGAAQEVRLAEIPFSTRELLHGLKVNW